MTPETFAKIRRVALECYPEPNYEDAANDAEYNQGWNACWEMYRKVFLAVEHDLVCEKCGAPAHRGSAREKLDSLLNARRTA